MGATSNADEVAAWLKEVIDGFGFHLAVENTTMGEDCVGIIAEGIMDRSIDDEAGPDGPWSPNAEPYRSWKAKKYGVDKPNLRTGQMLSLQSLMGRVTVDARGATMEYGTGEAPTRSSASAYFNPKTDGSITDIEKAYFCSQTRPFYAIDDAIAERVYERIGEALSEYLRQA